MFKRTISAGAMVAACVSGTVGAQQAPTPAHNFTGNLGLFSQYIFRGLTQTNKDPAVQGGFDYSHGPTGIYAGTWASNISWLRDGTPPAYVSGGSMEWDFYGGIKGNFGKTDFTWDVGTLYYWYPGNENPALAPATKANTWEVYGALGWKWLTAKYSYSIKDETFAVRDADGTWYLDLTATVPLGETGVTAIAHWGKQKYRGTDPRNAGGLNNDALYSYEDWKIGLSYALPKDFTIGAFYTDTSGANPLGYGSVAEGGVFPRNIAKGTATIFVQKTF